MISLLMLLAVSFAHADEIASCEIDVPQALIFGNVDAFEFNNSFGITFGYSPTGTALLTSASASVLVSNSSMALSLFAADPISQVDLYSSYVSQDQTNTTIDATIDFAKLSAKPEAILDSPLAQVTLSALEQSVASLSAQLKQRPWIGRILQTSSSGLVVLNAGSLAGVHVGDKFKIYNVQNFWAGEPCKSAYENSYRNPTSAGELTILQTADSTSFGKMTRSTGEAVLPGAEVHIEKLVGHRRTLKKKVKLGTIASKPITISGTAKSSSSGSGSGGKSSSGSSGSSSSGSGKGSSTTIDFAGAIAAQIQAVILSSDLVAD